MFPILNQSIVPCPVLTVQHLTVRTSLMHTYIFNTSLNVFIYPAGNQILLIEFFILLLIMGAFALSKDLIAYGSFSQNILAASRSGLYGCVHTIAFLFVMKMFDDKFTDQIYNKGSQIYNKGSQTLFQMSKLNELMPKKMCIFLHFASKSLFLIHHHVTLLFTAPSLLEAVSPLNWFLVLLLFHSKF